MLTRHQPASSCNRILSYRFGHGCYWLAVVRYGKVLHPVKDDRNDSYRFDFSKVFAGLTNALHNTTNITINSVRTHTHTHTQHAYCCPSTTQTNHRETITFTISAWNEKVLPFTECVSYVCDDKHYECPSWMSQLNDFCNLFWRCLNSKKFDVLCWLTLTVSTIQFRKFNIIIKFTEF